MHQIKSIILIKDKDESDNRDFNILEIKWNRLDPSNPTSLVCSLPIVSLPVPSLNNLTQRHHKITKHSQINTHHTETYKNTPHREGPPRNKHTTETERANLKK
jgi:hypothetical protein